MPRVDATIDDDLNAKLEADAKDQGVSRAALLRDIIQAHYSTSATPQTTIAGAEDLKALAAKIDAVARYLCLSRPLDDRLSSDEEAAGKKSWERWKKWAGRQ